MIGKTIRKFSHLGQTREGAWCRLQSDRRSSWTARRHQNLNNRSGPEPGTRRAFRSEAKAQPNLNHVNLALSTLFSWKKGNAFWSWVRRGRDFRSDDPQSRPSSPEERRALVQGRALLGIGSAHRMGIIIATFQGPANNHAQHARASLKSWISASPKVEAGHRPAGTRSGSSVGTTCYMVVPSRSRIAR